jgi:nucleotide-binding universal stress UspA family protein
MTTAEDVAPHIVVGVDGSDGAAAALDWATQQAARTGASLEIVTTWQWPTSYGSAFGFGDYDPQGDAGQIARRALDRIDLPGDRKRCSVLSGSAARHLVEASKRAELVVVGSRGHGAFAGLLLGSVSTHCVHHAACSVVVVRPPVDAEALITEEV